MGSPLRVRGQGCGEPSSSPAHPVWSFGRDVNETVRASFGRLSRKRSGIGILAAFLLKRSVFGHLPPSHSKNFDPAVTLASCALPFWPVAPSRGRARCPPVHLFHSDEFNLSCALRPDVQRPNMRPAHPPPARCLPQGLGVEQDNATAIEFFKKGAATGHAPSQNGLGYM
jgi:hypothetical protein